jgi:predicted RecB family nuclease
MRITEAIFKAFLQCPLKAHYLLSGRTPPKNEHNEFEEWVERIHIDKVRLALGSIFSTEASTAMPLVHEDLSAHPEALQRVGKSTMVVPVRIFPRARVSDLDRLRLGFDGLVIGHVHGKVPTYGVAIIGPDFAKSRVALPRLVRRARRAVDALRVLASGPAPRLVINRHCETCGFRDECRRRAVDTDDLSLMSGLKKAELAAAHKKGVFTITQFSHTFRPNRRRKRVRHEWALQALSIREKRTHVLVPLELPSRDPAQHVLFLDVEGDTEANSYYLVGVLQVSAARIARHSFWADCPGQEETIWQRLVDLADNLADFRIFHYGSYETTFLRRMGQRYPTYKPAIAARLRERATNVLGLIHGHVHFPTLSNGLKDIAVHLGFRWTEPGVTGLRCALWRRRWVHEPDVRLQDAITTYNTEDCTALRVVVDALYAIRDGGPGSDVVDAGTLKTHSLLGKFRKNVFALPELEFINNCAYFSYQRERILLRTNATVRRALRREERAVRRKPRVNSIVELKPPTRCPRCGVERPYRHKRFKKTQIDLRFGPGYIKRWVTEYRSAQYRCRSCRKTWFLKKYMAVGTKYGRNLGCWLIYQAIAQKQSSGSIIEILGETFGIHIHRQKVQIKKHELAEFYRRTYRSILRRISQAPMVQVDETKANILGATGYVWVFAAQDDVAFVYAGSRDGSTLGRVLDGFRGVLVSDFYAAYDSMPCAQQKCLVHLIRDMNDDLFRNQLDADLRNLVQTFSGVLKPIVATIDEHGLKRRRLRKHKAPVEEFFDDLAVREYRSEVAEKCRTRIVKCREKLFTFLEYDGVPWNNNGAENAIKDFAMLRRNLGGASTESGINDYLVLLSIRQTLKRRGVSFLNFLVSGKKDLERFALQ